MGSSSSSTLRTYTFRASKKVHPKRRGSVESENIPEYWNCQDTASPFRITVSCQEDAPGDFESVRELFARTSEDHPTHRLEVERVIRVEDSRQWHTYMQGINCIAKARSGSLNHALESPSMSKDVRLMRTKSGTVQDKPLTLKYLPDEFQDRINEAANEAYLWHGTDRHGAEHIIKEGLDPDRKAKHAQVLGRGCYFAESATLSDQYATEGEDGLHAMLLVRVCLGRVLVTKRYTRWRGRRLVNAVSTRVLVRTGQYDCVVGDRSKAFDLNIREYCVANVTQLYPEYMLLYRRVPKPTSNGASPNLSPKEIPRAKVNSDLTVESMSTNDNDVSASDLRVAADPAEVPNA